MVELTVPRGLIERAKASFLQVRMPMTPNQTVGDARYFYEIGYSHELPDAEKRDYVHLADIRTVKEGIGYSVRAFHDFPGRASDVLGFSTSAEGADLLAQKMAISWARQIGQNKPVYDFSQKDKSKLSRQVREIKEWSGGAQ